MGKDHDDPEAPPCSNCTGENGYIACVGAFCCPCCLSERHRLCCPCKLTLLGCLGCGAWTIVALVALWLGGTFLVLKPIVCASLDGEMYPSESWLESTAERDPGNFRIEGSQVGCRTWVDGIRIEDWRAPDGSWEEVFFESTDGILLRGFWFPASNASGASAEDAPTIIQVHGHGLYAAVQDQMIPARAMQDRGFNVLAFNNRGLGGSDPPPDGQAIRTFGADELADTEGALRFVLGTSTASDGPPFVTPLSRVGIFTVSGGNGMVSFFRQNISGLVMLESIYDWYVRLRASAGDLVSSVPFFDTILEQCIEGADTASGGIFEENYKDQLDREVFDPTGRQVLLLHNQADEYNDINDHGYKWKAALEREGFDVTTYFPNEQPPAGEEDCNAHTTLVWGPGRKAVLQELCEFWKSVFDVETVCEDVAWFDTKLSSA